MYLSLQPAEFPFINVLHLSLSDYLSKALNAMGKKATPDLVTERVFGFMQSANFWVCSWVRSSEGQLAAYFGIRSVFFVTCTLLLLNAVLVYTKIYKKLSKPAEPENKLVTRA